jgi:multicomponent Na+:H+ antiporter subunit E
MMRYFVYSLFLAIIWSFVKGDVSLGNIVLGLILAPFVIKAFKPLYQFRFEQPMSLKHVLKKIPKQLKFLWKLNYEIILANITVAKIVISPKMNIKPGIIAVPIRAKTNASITGIANSITLTPGTITIDISDDKKILYVHAIDASDPESIKEGIKTELEDYVLEAFE